MAYNDYIAELQGTIPRLPALHSAQLVNRAWSRIRDFRLWSFQVVADAQIFVPAVITAGTLTTTFGSTSVVADATAAAALDAVSLSTPPLAGLGVGRQIRLGNTSGLSSPTGPNYSILAWDLPTRTLTIDKPFGEVGQTNSNYQCLKCYYAAPGFPYTAPNTPDPNLIKFNSIINRSDGYSFRGKNLNWSQEMLNAIDPQRGGQGDAYIQANYGRIATTGAPMFELYPNPANFTTYYTTYTTRWPALSVSQDLPQMPYELSDCLMFMAKVLGAQWALANVVNFEELGRTNWVAFMKEMREEFRDSLIQCIKTDDEIMPQQVYRQGSGFDFPLGGQFIQGHDVSSLIPS